MKLALPSWTQLVQPSHPLVQARLSAVERSPNSPEEVTELFKDLQWVGTREVTSFEEVAVTKSGNCLALSTLLCSAASALGWRHSYVLVSGGGLLSRSLIVLSDKDSNKETVTVHAWAVLGVPNQEPMIVDPVKMEAEPLEETEAFAWRLQYAAPVDRLFPLVFNHEMVRLFPTPYSAHAFLKMPWKQ